MRTIVRSSLLVILTAVSGAACVTARAATPADRPALDVPDPPARVVAQVPAPEPPLLRAGGGRRTPDRDQAVLADAHEQAGAEGPAEAGSEAGPDRPPPKRLPPAQPPAPQLRMPEQRRRRRPLAPDPRHRRAHAPKPRPDQPRESQRPSPERLRRCAAVFVKQAEDALNAKNLVFARELADKAERLAKELLGR